jgi:hypothetical protein
VRSLGSHTLGERYDVVLDRIIGRTNQAGIKALLGTTP